MDQSRTMSGDDLGEKMSALLSPDEPQFQHFHFTTSTSAKGDDAEISLKMDAVPELSQSAVMTSRQLCWG